MMTAVIQSEIFGAENNKALCLIKIFIHTILASFQMITASDFMMSKGFVILSIVDDLLTFNKCLVSLRRMTSGIKVQHLKS